ncbi:MAG: 5'-nucleotidase, lipoprotein e(P4) family [Bacteroidetes bacterium 4572_114]|nr:MAG: 5'-nucleotidase, lipoprotein e(P4) family [Bacteroidetes bacterium 4572_114]
MKRLYFSLSIISAYLLMTGCDRPNETNNKDSINEHLIVATLYHQQAAEMKALTYQAYNIARCRLDEKLKGTDNPAGLAIVLDIDETVLDNSPYEAKTILENISYPEGWDEWMNLANADALPGAVDFLNYANQHGVGIFYITNRKEKYRKQTMKNLLEKGFPQAVNEHLLLRTDESSKEKRRNLVSENHEIFLLLGDNLSDFDMIFDKKNSGEREATVKKLRDEFGKKFIILPNTMYGDWLGAIYDYDHSLDNQQKLENYKQNLRGF